MYPEYEFDDETSEDFDDDDDYGYVGWYSSMDEDQAEIEDLKKQGYIEVDTFTKSFSDYVNDNINFKVIAGDCKEVTVDQWYSGKEVALYCKPGSVARFFELHSVDDPETGRSLDEQVDGLIIVRGNGKVEEYTSYYVEETSPFGSSIKKEIADVCKVPKLSDQYIKEYCKDVDEWLENM